MFERRLRVFLALLFIGGLILAARAAQVQVSQHGEWERRAELGSERVRFLTPRRGDIVDVKGVVLATDVASFEACVNYRAVPAEPDAAWLAAEARRRARKLPEWRAAADEAARATLLAREVQGVRADLEAMWTLLARLSGQDRAQIELVRADVTQEVEAKHAAYWRGLYAKAQKDFEELPPAPWYERWVAGARVAPTPESFQDKPIGEQLAFHPIVADVSQAVYNELKLAQDRFPQYKPDNAPWRSVLELRPAVRRSYPLGDVACHVIGRVGPVSREDRADDPNRADERRRYALIDRIGREGLEALAEQQLRGKRGEHRTDRAGAHLGTAESEPGQTIRATIDVALQADIQRAFARVDFEGPDKDAQNHAIPERMPMNGAAVVIDVRTGEVRALVSVPTFDLNKFDELYPKLVADELNWPMRNRALMDAVEPGSTAKPIVGLAAITEGLLGVHDTVECDGYAHITDPRGRPFTVQRPRCWTMSMFGKSHHTTPYGAPHPTGFLTLADAIERSCNVYFVTESARLGLEGLSNWMQRFGYGRITGIGLPEARGLVPTQARIPADERFSAPWLASIGQGKVNATPIQVANEMATIARLGIWMRPRLVPAGAGVPLPTTRPDGSAIEERVDLKLNPDAVRAVHAGMFNVVNGEAGTGKRVRDPASNVKVAAKTGSATASQLSRPLRGPDGVQLRDERGFLRTEAIPYGTMAAPNRDIPWYRTSGVDEATGRLKGTHSWVGGFAPADKPEVAFAVYVEYGNSGGVAAGSVVRELIRACVRHGYVTEPGGRRPMPELMRDALPPTIARPTDEPVNTED